MRIVLALVATILMAGAAQAQYGSRYYYDGPRYRDYDRGPPRYVPPHHRRNYYEHDGRRYERWHRRCRNEIRIDNIRLCLDK